ncbi:M20 family metallopeptidase [Pseudovibrio exalbescens]|uniref:M20 aminoacylase family protein n=1 Tax=Pseudovibrio exalbescens TaxID=197461 RepID=UPI0023663F39|nr:M20 aminoacylase family protein [Pseudovibrio exalbescens]MDD7911723.1 M20 family metallopeptidase [Pseudovibrio exalbescens]
MPIVNRLAELHDEITAWRRDFHENPEILYETHRTAARVAELLESFGVDDITTGIGQTGVVGVIKGKNGGAGKTIGLRADMDALPLTETSGKPWASKHPGKMHACGHDGHTAMLLGTAKYLAETRNFDGTVVLIFQPAEEGGAGAKAMINDGLMTRWNIDEVYGLHNMPGLPVGEFAIRPGPLMAATDEFQITIKGLGGHAARPYETIDPIVVGAQLVTALQSIVSRNTNALEAAVISVTVFEAGSAFNIVPETAKLRGTVRTLSNDVREMIETRMKAMVESVCAAHGATADILYDKGYPVTNNHADQTDFAVQVAREVTGSADKVNSEVNPTMGGEDFSFMLEERPGAFIFAGNGDTAKVHNPAYDFNDELIPYGCSYFIKLVETAMPTSG